MLLPGMLFLLVFSFMPMFGVVIAFEKFIPTKGIFRSPWVGLGNFAYMFQLPDSAQVFFNTIVISVLKIAFGLLVPLVYSLLLNEIGVRFLKRTIQTIIYLPHFLSWVILASLIMNLTSLDGMINVLLSSLGIKPVFFMASNSWFKPIAVASDVWKEAGFGTIIYLAALTGINPVLYEASVLDGASRLQQLWHVTLPGIATTVVLLAVLSLGNVLNAGFDQIFNLYNPLVYASADIIDTYVYRTGLVNAQYGLATAVGLMKSVVSLGLIVLSYKLADRFANYRIF